MQVFGNIATDLTRRTGKESGKTFYTFRLAENNGEGANATTTWYEVVGFLDELDADLLAMGQFVKVTGRIEAEAYSKRDGSPGASLKLVTGSVVYVPKKEPSPQGAQQGAAPTPARAATPARAPAAPPVAAQPAARQPSPAERAAAQGFDDMDDDIPF